MFVFLPEGNYTCRKCKMISLAEEQEQGWEAHLSMLYHIGEGEEFMGRIHETFLRGQQQHKEKVSQKIKEQPKQEEGM